MIFEPPSKPKWGRGIYLKMSWEVKGLNLRPLADVRFDLFQRQINTGSGHSSVEYLSCKFSKADVGIVQSGGVVSRLIPVYR